jgi:hypothetical protein
MNRPTIRSRVGHEPARRQGQALAFLVGICLAALLSFLWAGQACRSPGQGAAVCTPERINPNDASVASLMRLPGVGLTRARAIVDYRSRPAGRTSPRPAFADGQDMQRIKGFGPATVEDILPWLQFLPAPAEPSQLSDANE